jgi:hypothetical protein
MHRQPGSARVAVGLLALVSLLAGVPPVSAADSDTPASQTIHPCTSKSNELRRSTRNVGLCI